jgi:hypothetical protein
MKLVCVVLMMLTIAGNAVAQSATEPRDPLSSPSLELPSAEALLSQSPPVATEPRDSLKNGVIIGAAIGAGALGGFGLWICQMLKEPGDPSCWPGTLAIAGIGAGIGAAAGAGIDALSDRTAAPTRVSTLPPGRRISVTWTRRF